MSEIWQIIGISSLIATIASIIGNAIANIYVEKKHFQRESEAEYIKDQIKLYSKIYFLLQRVYLGAISQYLFQKFIDDTKDLNDVIKNYSFLLETEILINWIIINRIFTKIPEVDEGEEKKYMDTLWPKIEELNSLICEHVNNVLNPLYKEIVGKTVPDLIYVEGAFSKEEMW